jgi:hypothetical protein
MLGDKGRLYPSTEILLSLSAFEVDGVDGDIIEASQCLPYVAEIAQVNDSNASNPRRQRIPKIRAHNLQHQRLYTGAVQRGGFPGQIGVH